MGRKIFSVLIVGLFVYVAFPLLMPLAMGAVVAVLFFPLFERLERRAPSYLVSALLTVSVTLLVLLPSALLAFLAGKAGLQQLKLWRDSPKPAGGTSVLGSFVNSTHMHSIVEKLSNWFPFSGSEIISAAEDLARTIGIKVADLLAGAFGQLPTFAMGLVIMVLSIYFFLADGRRLVAWVRDHSVYGKEQTEQLIHAIAGMCRSVVFATIISGVVQGLVYMTACFVVGLRGAPLIGFIVFLSSFIPLIGSFPVTISVALQQLLIGQTGHAVFLLIVAIIVGFSDNVIKPIVIKGGANLHPLLAFVAAFGGLQAFGFAGVFLGPIIAGICVVTIKHLVRS